MCFMLFDLRYGTMNSLERYFRWHGRLVARQVEKSFVFWIFFFLILAILQLPAAVPAGLPDVDPDPGPGPGQLQGGARPDQGENTGL